MEREGPWVSLGTISGPVRVRHRANLTANVFCMYVLRGSHATTGIDARHRDFGDTFVVFTDGDEFLARARAAAERLGLEMQSKLVEYVDPLVYRGSMGIFRKYARFSFQSECRLALLPGNGAPFCLRLGSLADICLIGDLHDSIVESRSATATLAKQPSPAGCGSLCALRLLTAYVRRSHCEPG
jgi:hypothetical protein